MKMVAALFVAKGGPYFGIPGVDPWDKDRDARRYTGTHPVVAHPPCERWGDLWSGGPLAAGTRRRGDDGGCFVAALEAVRRWGGVLEHPAHSQAWRAFELTPPPAAGWAPADFNGGWTCQVEQGHYGHRARKATWLYANGVALPSLKWGPSARRLPRATGAAAQHMSPPRGMSDEQRAERRQWLEWYERETGKAWCCPELMSKRERAATPEPFRDLLLSIARNDNSESVPACDSDKVR